MRTFCEVCAGEVSEACTCIARKEREKVLEVLDNFFGRLETAAFNLNGEYYITWADVDCLYGEMKDELRQEKKE